MLHVTKKVSFIIKSTKQEIVDYVNNNKKGFRLNKQRNRKGL